MFLFVYLKYYYYLCISKLKNLTYERINTWIIWRWCCGTAAQHLNTPHSQSATAQRQRIRHRGLRLGAHHSTTTREPGSGNPAPRPRTTATHRAYRRPHRADAIPHRRHRPAPRRERHPPQAAASPHRLISGSSAPSPPFPTFPRLPKKPGRKARL